MHNTEIKNHEESSSQVQEITLTDSKIIGFWHAANESIKRVKHDDKAEMFGDFSTNKALLSPSRVTIAFCESFYF